MTNTQTVYEPGRRPRRADAVRVHQRWVETANVVNQSILAVHKLSLSVKETTARAFLGEFVASLEDVNDALHDLHVAVIDPRVRPWLLPDSSPLGAYISVTYTWCANVLSALRELLELGEGTWDIGEQALAERSAVDIHELIEPLFRRLDELCEPVRSGDHPLNWIWSRAQRLESEIACVDWELRSERPPAPSEDDQ